MKGAIEGEPCIIRVVILLEGFREPVPECSLGNEIRLRPPYEHELTTLAKENRIAVIEPVRVMALEGRFEFLGSVPGFGVFQKLQSHVEKAALAMRFVLSGTLGWRMTCFSSPQQDEFEIFPLVSYTGNNALSEGPVEANADRLDEVAALWDKTRSVLQALEEWPRLRIALDRFSDSYGRRNRADKLIDLAICLEALFGDRGSRSKALAIAELVTKFAAIGDAGRCNEDVKGEVQRLYQTRNQAVHGEECDCSTEEVLSWKALARTCLRQYLLFAATSSSHDSVILKTRNDEG